MKYRYIIIDEWDAVWGTNDREAAETAAEGTTLVVDTKSSELITSDGVEDIDGYDAPEPDPEDEE